MTDGPGVPSAFDRLRICLQDILDDAGDGWQLAHYVIALGLERMDGDGNIAHCAWMLSPTSQADYITDGLIDAAETMRAVADIEDD